MKLLLTIFSSLFITLFLTQAFAQQSQVISGPFLVREGVTFDQNTDEPITGVVQTYYEHGQLATIENYKDGRRDGISEIFHYENGNSQRRENYKEGMSDGIARNRERGLRHYIYPKIEVPCTEQEIR